MEVTLLGTGDTTGLPTVGCSCDTCGAARERGVDRSRFSVHVHNETTGESLLVDASPDFRQQFLTNDVALPDAAVITHIHFDHLHGLGNLFRLCDALPVYAAGDPDPALEGVGDDWASVAATVETDYDYLSALSVASVQPYRSFEAAGFEVTLVPVDHPPVACYGVVVEGDGATLAISGDTTYDLPARSTAAMAGADALVVDGIVHAGFCERHPRGGRHEDADGVPRTFASKHMTFTGARALAADLDVTDYRIVHVSHFVPPELAFASDIAVDGEILTP
jgi:phosphoribosyl 1,2-cyclic phosphate phosphodiesterase